VRLPVGGEPFPVDPARFTTAITNPYWTMTPGTRWTYKELDEQGHELQAVVVVTNETKKMADGVTARVVRDTLSQGRTVLEDTIDWYAQDDQGNVWYLGEQTAELENGKVTSTAGSFEAGVDGALPGVIVPGQPQPGLHYRQEYYQGKAEDSGAILSLDEMAQVPLGLYKQVLLTKETVAIEPDVLEYKFYAKGIGPVLSIDISGGHRRSELVSIDTAPAGAGAGPIGRPNG